MLSKIFVYIFSILGFICVIFFLTLYIFISYKVINKNQVLQAIQKFGKIDVISLCPQILKSEKAKTEIQNQPYTIWAIENLDAEESAKALLSLSNDDIVKYLNTIDREKSIKILQEIYRILTEQGEIGTKRKQEMDKKLFGQFK